MKDNCFEVLEGGFLTTIQDIGRFGYASRGVSKSGASDIYSFKIANFLLQNNENSLTLEISYGLAKFLVLKPIHVSITGSNLNPMVNNYKVPMWRTLKLEKNDILSFGTAKIGFRSYIGIAGGINVPLVLGSGSTHLASKLGGISGKGLQKGDLISSYTPLNEDKLLLYLGNKNEGSKKINLRVIPGPQEDHFSPEILERFYSNPFKSTEKIDRIGVALDGPDIPTLTGNHDLISDVTPEGSIQVPGNGKPIILLSDCQTTGGYPKIGVVASVDLPKLGQIGTSDSINFEKITLEEAERLYKIRDEEFSKNNFSEIVIKEYSIGIINSKYDVKLYKDPQGKRVLDDISVTVNGENVEVKENIQSDVSEIS